MESIEDLAQQCAALHQAAGCCDVGHRTQIEITGADRAKVLHGLCTNDINRLTPGTGCEAFLTNVQGKTIGYVYVFCRADSLILDTAPGWANELIPSLDRYIIREDVTLLDRSASWRELLVSGREASSLLLSLGATIPPAAEFGNTDTSISGWPVHLRRVSYCSANCFFLSCRDEEAEAVLSELRQAGAALCSAEAVEVSRIEMGTPVFGVDVTADNLPQEVGRDAQAISFRKGCYLGQETVARIDALGHVNRLLVGLRFAGQAVPPPGSVLTSDGKSLARITSSAWSPRLAAPLALAYVRRGHEAIGTRLACEPGVAEVVRLPLPD